MTSINENEALIIARHIAAGAYAMRGTSEDFCLFMRYGAYDGYEAVMAAKAALLISPEFLEARIKEIRSEGAAA